MRLASDNGARAESRFLTDACVFGLRTLVTRMLGTGLVSLNSNAGKVVGFYPLHAVTANGLRSMYDFLVRELPEGDRADKSLLTQSGRLISLNMDGMSPLQLTARIGLRYITAVATRCYPLLPVSSH